MLTRVFVLKSLFYRTTAILAEQLLKEKDNESTTHQRLWSTSPRVINPALTIICVRAVPLCHCMPSCLELHPPDRLSDRLFFVQLNECPNALRRLISRRSISYSLVRPPSLPYELNFSIESQFVNVGATFFDELKHSEHIVSRDLINIPYVHRVPTAECGCIVPCQQEIGHASCLLCALIGLFKEPR